MRIFGNAISTGPDSFHTYRMLHVFEDHLEIMKRIGEITVLQIEPLIVYKYNRDWIGLLLHLKIDPKYHWVVIRFNGFSSFSDDMETIEQILLPDFSLVETIFNTERTRARLN